MADGQISDRLEVLDPGASDAESWSHARPLPEGRSAYAIVGGDGAFYLFGGWDGSAYVASTYRYDLATDQWSELSPMPTARAFAGAGRIDNQVYVVGGYNGEDELATCEVYDLASDTWASCPAMQAPRGGAGVTVIGDTLYVVGGGWASYLVENEHYNPAQGQWITFPSPVLQEWRNLGVASNGTFLYAIGGWDGDYVGTTQAYRALYRLYMPGPGAREPGTE
jgi:hypothetical protein